MVQQVTEDHPKYLQESIYDKASSLQKDSKLKSYQNDKLNEKSRSPTIQSIANSPKLEINDNSKSAFY